MSDLVPYVDHRPVRAASAGTDLEPRLLQARLVDRPVRGVGVVRIMPMTADGTCIMRHGWCIAPHHVPHPALPTAEERRARLAELDAEMDAADAALGCGGWRERALAATAGLAGLPAVGERHTGWCDSCGKWRASDSGTCPDCGARLGPQPGLGAAGG